MQMKNVFNQHGAAELIRRINRVHSKSQKCGGCKAQTLTIYIK